MNARYEFHPENGDHPHVCAYDADGSVAWAAFSARDMAEENVALRNDGHLLTGEAFEAKLVELTRAAGIDLAAIRGARAA